MRMWMIRHADLTLSRPIPEPLLVSRIESGSIDRSDEICLSGSYWFPVQDVAEIRKFLGEINLVALIGAESERTRTDHVAIELEDPDEDEFPEDADEKTPVPRASPAAASGSPAPHGPGPAAVFPNPSPVRAPVSSSADPSLSFRPVAEDVDGSAAPGAQILLIVALLVIFCGTIALLWIASK